MTARPRYHVTAPSNWLNDPNGPFQLGGVHHLFYQYNPHEPVWGPPHWGHLTSTDLVHWQDRPVALSPGGSEADQDGCWSGCARVIDGRPALFYTGVVGSDDDRVEAVCRADPGEDLDSWHPRREALVPGPPDELGPGPHRDPHLVEEDDGWSLLVGSDRGGPGPGGTVLRYTSDDLEHWEFDGVFLHRPAGDGHIDTGLLWECPQLLTIDGHDVLVVSVQVPADAPNHLKYAVWFVGQVVDGRFEASSTGRLDLGDVLYAPTLSRDESGRPLLFGWLRELVGHEQSGKDHAGALSLPRTLAVVEGRVVTRPVAEVALLRERPLAVTDEDDHVVLPRPQVEIRVEPGSDESTMQLLDRDDRVLAEVRVAPTDDTLHLTTARPLGSVTGTVPLSVQLPLRRDGPAIWFDEEILEVFSGGASASTRLPEAPARLRLHRVPPAAVSAHLLRSGVPAPDERLHPADVPRSGLQRGPVERT